jgi:superfamily II DNA or RNA helicase
VGRCSGTAQWAAECAGAPVTNEHVTLRPYQRAAIDNIRKDWDSGLSDVMITMATGGGKTVVFLQALDEVLQPNQRALILAHRTELITQPLERIRDMFPHRYARTGVVQAHQNDAHTQITIATVQTLQSDKRIKQLLAAGAIDYLVIDEAHHATAATYVNVVKALKDVNPDMKHLGVTATPIRADAVGLRNVYQKESAHYGIRELVKQGYLAPPRWLAIETGISLAGVRSQGSGASRDFNQTQLASVFETDNCFELVVETHKKYAADRPAIAFTASVAGATALAQAFNDAGITAVAADGTMTRESRAQCLVDFRAGRVQVLCNCALWTEGLDLPEVSCIHQVRPTQSDGLYTQMVGRALRPMPNKVDALILDYVPKETRNIAMMGDVLGVEARKDVYVKDADEVEEGDVVAGFTFDGELKWLEGNPMELVSRTLDYLSLTPWKWQQPHGKHGAMVLGLGRGEDGVDRTLVISKPDETVTCWLVARREGERWHRAYEVRKGTFEDVSEWANEYAYNRGSKAIAGKQRSWASNAPSDGQVNYASALGVWREGMTRGECADAITTKVALDAVKRLGVRL